MQFQNRQKLAWYGLLAEIRKGYQTGNWMHLLHASRITNLACTLICEKCGQLIESMAITVRLSQVYNHINTIKYETVNEVYDRMSDAEMVTPLIERPYRGPTLARDPTTSQQA